MLAVAVILHSSAWEKAKQRPHSTLTTWVLAGAENWSLLCVCAESGELRVTEGDSTGLGF